ncbi:Maf1 regulator-domain-containing protein [Zygosaccharomyces rouxii]|nr:Maf1 regulator-domain-containing protein [Zygosaccharomyces rouxii]
MKFIDELDVERVNQTLNFETSDCRITGGCDIFTTKPVASDKKLYKRIDDHLGTLLQENEGYNAALRQHASLESSGSLSPISGEINQIQHPNSNSISNSWTKDSFWEQKRRMSVNENGSPSASFSPNSGVKTNKLNDQNLKELVSNSESRYMSSPSPGDSNSNSNPRSFYANRRTSSSTGLQPSKSAINRRRSSAVNDPANSINIGPFGPINETASRRTFAYLIAILNASFPDHDFSSLEPTDFLKISLKSMISKFENSLYSLGKNPEEWMWEIINSHLDMPDCVIYQYSPPRSFLDDEPGYLWSLVFFLFNKKRKRVAYLYLISSRLESPTEGNVNEDEEREKLNQKRRTVIDDEAADYEGEYDLVYDENAIEDDADDAVEVTS